MDDRSAPRRAIGVVNEQKAIAAMPNKPAPERSPPADEHFPLAPPVLYSSGASSPAPPEQSTRTRTTAREPAKRRDPDNLRLADDQAGGEERTAGLGTGPARSAQTFPPFPGDSADEGADGFLGR